MLLSLIENGRSGKFKFWNFFGEFFGTFHAALHRSWNISQLIYIILFCHELSFDTKIVKIMSKNSKIPHFGKFWNIAFHYQFYECSSHSTLPASLLWSYMKLKTVRVKPELVCLIENCRLATFKFGISNSSKILKIAQYDIS